MSIRLGILLGEYDGSMSFEVLSNWATGSGSFAVEEQTSITHSSNNALHLVSNSDGGTQEYEYNGLKTEINSFGSSYRFNPFSSENIIDFHFFAYTDVNTWSGLLNLSAQNININIDSKYNHYHLTYVASNETIFSSTELRFRRVGTNSSELYVDDCLVSAQTIELQSDRNLQRLSKINLQSNQSLGGKETSTNFGESRAWSLPLNNVPETDAKAINRWQILGRPLLLWLNTSDQNDLYIVNITNNSIKSISSSIVSSVRYSCPKPFSVSEYSDLSAVVEYMLPATASYWSNGPSLSIISSLISPYLSLTT